MDHLSLSLPLRILLLLIKNSCCPRKSTVKSLFLCLARKTGKTKKKSHLLKPPPPPPQLKREINYSILIFFFSRIFSSDHLHKLNILLAWVCLLLSARLFLVNMKRGNLALIDTQPEAIDTVDNIILLEFTGWVADMVFLLCF